ncbi:MAG: M23 family metallopeptidase [Chloroflexi bacterium]|nr:M23 family metallopeptidase [Chloroflexota bacterium]
MPSARIPHTRVPCSRLGAGLAALTLLLTACTTPVAAPAPSPTAGTPPATATAEPTATTPPATATAAPTATPTAPATPTVSATATSAPPTFTPTKPPPPTATRAAPSATPTRPPQPTATAVAPPAAATAAAPDPPAPGPLARFDPPTVKQGAIAVLRVRIEPGGAVEGSFDGKPLLFSSTANEAWAVVGIARAAPLGGREAQVKVRQGSGAPVLADALLNVTSANFPLEDIELPPGQGDLLDPAVVQAEFNLIQGQSRTSPPERRWEGAFLRPAAGEVSSIFGIRRSYNGGPPTGSHEGLDIAANAGDPIRAAAAGKVVIARKLWVRGNAVMVDHGMGVVTGYYHMTESVVKEGQDVERGQLLGRVGSTGLATGPHLHWDVIVGGVNVDPVQWTLRVAP